jgi:hypothetical protein
MWTTENLDRLRRCQCPKELEDIQLSQKRWNKLQALLVEHYDEVS